MKRRTFIQRLGLLSGSAFISLNSSAFAGLERAATIQGRVSAGGRGIAGVSVSDGYTVVRTDAQGKYSLKPHEQASFVFISTPAGYEFKTDYNLARQYDTLGVRNAYDFNLTQLKRNDDRHNFLIWADPQVKTKADVQEMMATSVPDVQELVRSMGNIPVHGIAVGDLVWDNHALFADYNEAVKQMGIPFFQALGNHDMDYRQGGDETSDKTFKQQFGPTYYSFNRGKAHYVVFDDVRYLGVERTYDGYISEQQLSWLEQDLKTVPKDNLLFICLHIPVHNSVKNNKALYALLEGYKNVHILSGHTHYSRNVQISENIYEHNHGTVCGAWWTGPVCSDGSPRGYGVYEVNGKNVKWYYKGTGLPKTHQVSLDVERTAKQVRLIANVWNYDPQWKVEYLADGRKMGNMEMTKGFDPECVRLYRGQDMPKKRPFVEPHRTEHLFLAQLPASVKNVEVVVTDRFGEKYKIKKDV
ncbi:metallophosphoesterase [Pedobacter yulinensis]|uniref:Metallophosphoesterase n=1 Tax=Pedobacter yulinensis TaxID=2126353 RepID=A0A2T3HGN5_9SPHI|nr:calcineurin-like phosphoesterase family protein [Pedobacter yulinensis]PST81597.1 metallophosphoesterase [Pedobacter yulinensis]